jgi:hypothetical protein
MGAGPDLEGWDSAYPLVIDSLAQQGLTNSRAFSMDLRGLDSARGECGLFFLTSRGSVPWDAC